MKRSTARLAAFLLLVATGFALSGCAVYAPDPYYGYYGPPAYYAYGPVYGYGPHYGYGGGWWHGGGRGWR